MKSAATVQLWHTHDKCLTNNRDLGQLLRIVTDTPQPHTTVPFDERSALAELEQLAEKIQLSRRQRERAVAEFDAFVKTFRYDRYTASIAETDRELRRRAEDRPQSASVATHAARAAASPAAATTAPAEAVTATIDPASVLPAPVEDSFPWGSGVERAAVAQLPGTGPRIRAAHVGVGLATIAVIAVAVLLWRSSSGPVGPATPTNPSVAPPSSPATAPSAQPAAAVAPAPAPAAPAGPPRALNIEFITTRPVWARITIDGRKAIEKEFPADQRIPLGADRTILIRAGDAGAVRLVVDGKDLGPLGKDGQIFSRAFTAAER